MDNVISGRSVSTMRVGGRDYPLYTAPRCGVCRCTERKEIERSILKGTSVLEIARTLAPNANIRTRYGSDVTMEKGLYTHRLSHMPAQLLLRVHQLEMSVRRQGLDPDDEMANKMNAITLADMVVQIAGERLMADELEPTLADGLAAAKLQVTIAKEMGESSISPVESAQTTAHVIGEVLSSMDLSDEVFAALRKKLVGDERTAIFFAPELPSA